MQKSGCVSTEEGPAIENRSQALSKAEQSNYNMNEDIEQMTERCSPFHQAAYDLGEINKNFTCKIAPKASSYSTTETHKHYELLVNCFLF